MNNENSQNHILVSIIIPAYNTEKYIHRAIESSLRQTHNNVEVIVVDDGSNDNTLELARSYAEKDSRVRVFHKENGGVSSARNMGIREAHGEYIIFLDSDDWLEDYAVETLLNEQLKNPDRLIVARMCIVIIDWKHQKFYRPVIRTGNLSKTFTLSIEKALANMDKLKIRNIQATIFSSEVISRKKLKFSPKYNYGEDTFFTFEYLYGTNGVVFIDKVVLNYIIRPGSATYTEMIKYEYNDEDFLQAIIDYPANSDSVRELMKARYARINLSLLNQMLNAGIESEKLKMPLKKTKRYMNEFFRSGNISLAMKVFYLLEVCMPIPLARIVSYIFFFVRNMKNKAAIKLKAEAVDMW